MRHLKRLSLYYYRFDFADSPVSILTHSRSQYIPIKSTLVEFAIYLSRARLAVSLNNASEPNVLVVEMPGVEPGCCMRFLYLLSSFEVLRILSKLSTKTFGIYGQ